MSVEAYAVTRWKWRCSHERCIAYDGIGTYRTEADALTDAARHDQAGHREDGTSKQQMPSIGPS